MRFGVLGTFEVRDELGEVIDVGGAQPRALLVVLLLALGRTVPVASIVSDLWGEDPPASATGTLQSYVSRLRRSLGAGALAFEAGGYRLQTDAHDVDFRRFAALADEGRSLLAEGDAAGARERLQEAVSLWRGPALHEFTTAPWASGAAARLEERRLGAVEDRVEAELALGMHDGAVHELTALVADHPLRERCCANLAVALYRSGRQADALRVLGDLRERLLDELGVDPGPMVRQLELQILNQDPALLGPPRTTPGSSGAPLVANTARHVIGFQPDIVGRAAERRLLADLLRGVLGGRSLWAVIEGEAGIGKTRLVDDLAEHAVAEGVDVLWGRSYEVSATPAFWPWLPMLRPMAEAVGPLPDPAVQDLLERLLAHTGQEDLLSSAMDPRRFQLFEAVATLLEAAAERMPRMFILDDVQWADVASVELAEFLAGRIFSGRLLFVITARAPFAGNEAATRVISAVGRRGGTARLRLGGVEPQETRLLIEQAVGRRPSDAVVDAIHARGSGNPFFIRELAHLLDAEADLTDAEVVRRLAVPVGVRDVVQHRIASLPAETQSLLQAAAVLGRGVRVPLLARAADTTLDACAEGLEPALAGRLLIEAPGDAGAVRFAHALVQEVVLADLPMLRRARLHRRAAELLEGPDGPADDDAEIVAEHLWQASSIVPGARVAEALERAAEVAARRLALETSVDLLERALVIRQSLPAAEVDAAIELEAIRRATAVRRSVSGYTRAMDHLPRAKELARRAHSYDVLCELLWTEWAGVATVGGPGESFRLAHEIAEVARESEVTAHVALAHHVRGITEVQFGSIVEGCAILDRAVSVLGDVAEQSTERWFAWTVETNALNVSFQAIAHQIAGTADPAIASLRPVIDATDEPFSRLVLWVFEAMRATFASDLDAAWVAAKTAVEEASERSFAFYLAGATAVLGELKARTGSHAAGLADLDRALSLWTELGTRTFHPWFMSRAALACLLLDDAEGAERWVERGVAALARTGEQWQEPALEVARARIAGHRGASEEEVQARIDAACADAWSRGLRGLVPRLRDPV